MGAEVCLFVLILNYGQALESWLVPRQSPLDMKHMIILIIKLQLSAYVDKVVVMDSGPNSSIPTMRRCLVPADSCATTSLGKCMI